MASSKLLVYQSQVITLILVFLYLTWDDFFCFRFKRFINLLAYRSFELCKLQLKTL